MRRASRRCASAPASAQRGTVFLITLGTGTGSALFYNGWLVPNLELGHMEIRGRDAERRSAAAARIKRGISWKAWAADLDEHLLAIERLFSPRMFIIGGGVSKRSERFIPRLTVRAQVVPARLLQRRRDRRRGDGGRRAGRRRGAVDRRGRPLAQARSLRRGRSLAQAR